MSVRPDSICPKVTIENPLITVQFMIHYLFEILFFYNRVRNSMLLNTQI